MSFDYGPTPQVLQGLSAGQLASRWQRTVRLWWLLRSLYGGNRPWSETLPQPFRYPDLRSRLFAARHGEQDQCSLALQLTHCQGTNCICQRSLQALLLAAAPTLDIDAWITEMAHLTGLSDAEWQTAMIRAPFAVSHRSLRDDVQALVQLGWLRQISRGQFGLVLPIDWPALSGSPLMATAAALSLAETWDLLRVLEEIAFVQPQLNVVIDRLWEQVTQLPAPTHGSGEPEKRIFIHLDYILPQDMQERVDTLQYDIEQLWRQPDGGVIQFELWMARQERQTMVTVYPVCLHYARRAKYLSAYGRDPKGQMTWHNYRLDRIVSERLTVLPWGDPRVPRELKGMRDRGELPTPSQVEDQLAVAWGFNFYLPKAWLLMRFSPWFAQGYVDNTERHPTFERVAHGALRSLIAQYVPIEEQAQVQRIVAARFSAKDASRSPQDVYYAGWVRLGDINVVMRLRDWRPQGEVIAPWSLRQQMAVEVQQEVQHYREDGT